MKKKTLPAILQETVYRIAEAAQAAESLQDLYPQIQRQVASVMYAENFYIALYDEQTDLLHFVFSLDEVDAFMDAIHPGKGLTAYVLRTGKSLLYIPEKDTLGIEVLSTPSKVWLGVPLNVQGKTIGVMAVQHYKNAQVYTEREQRMLEYVSSQVATAIDRKQSEEALRLSERRNNALIQNAPDGIILLDREGRFVFASPSALRIFGYETQELLGVASVDLMYPDDRSLVLEIRQQFVLNPTKVITNTYRVRHKNGNYRWIEATYTNLFDEPSVNALVVNFRDITEHKLANALLVQSQASLELAQQIAHLGSWELNPASGVGLSWSKEMFRLFEREPVQGVPKLDEFMSWLCPDDRQALLEAQQRAIESQTPVTVEYCAKLASGEPHYYQVTISAICNANGVLQKITGTTLDITQRKQVEENARYREKLLEKVIQLGKNITAITDLDQCLRAIHQNVQLGLGFDRVGLFLYEADSNDIRGVYGTSRTGQIEDNSWYKFPAQEWPAWQIALHSPTGIALEADYQAVHHPAPDNEMYGVKQHISLAAWAGDKPVALITVDNLISGRQITPADLEALQLFAGYAGLAIENARMHVELEKRVEERTAEVRRSEATYRALFENSNDGIFLLNPAGEDLTANQQALKMLGYTLEEYQALTRDNLNAVAAPEQHSDADERFAAVLRGEIVPLYERTFVRKDGSQVEVEINLSPVRDSLGKIIMVQSVVREITARKKAEEALRESRDQLSLANIALEKASRMKDEFLASMSHELRTPLTGILGISEALQLQTYGPLSEKQLRSIKMIESSGRHLLTLINDILDLSKIEAGKFDMQFEPCVVAEICQASLQLVKGLAHQKKQNVQFSIHPSSITVRADPRRLKQMLVNLLSNAVKFTPEGGLLGLEVHVDLAERAVFFSVWDRGIGIRSEDLADLFKPFVQLDSRLARQYSGTGLGLSLVKRMAELHDGKIKVESVVGEGSRFTISLPWSTDVTRPMPELDRSALRTIRKVLVIEDRDIDLDLNTRYLRELGVTYTVHPQFANALKKAAVLHPDAILLDLDLPDGSGMDLLAELKMDERTRDIPVIIISVMEQRAEAEKLGTLGYLLKPYSREELHFVLEKAATFIEPVSPVLTPDGQTAAPLVMIADDNEQLLDMLTDFLEAQGYRTMGVASGFELLKRLPKLRPNLVILDIQMPGMDGLETVRRLRAQSDSKLASTPVIAVTALAMPGDRERCLAAGADEYLSKPVVLVELVEQVKRLLEK